MQFLAFHWDSLGEVVQKTVGDLQLGYRFVGRFFDGFKPARVHFSIFVLRPVVSIPSTTVTKKAFEIILEKRVSGIAVIDEKGFLVSSLSATDLKAIGRVKSAKKSSSNF